MPAGIAERQRRVDGALDGQQTVEDGIFRTGLDHIILRPLLAAWTTTCRSLGGGTEGGAFARERAAAPIAVTLRTWSETVHSQSHRGVRHARASCSWNPARYCAIRRRPLRGLEIIVMMLISIHASSEACRRCGRAAMRPHARRPSWNGRGNARHRDRGNRCASTNHGTHDGRRRP